MKKYLLFIGILISFLLSMSCVLAVEVPETIRIGLFYDSSAKNSITLSSPGGMDIGVMKNGTFELITNTKAGEKVTVARTSAIGAVLVSGHGQVGSENAYPYFKSKAKNGVSLISVDGKQYRGNIEIRRFSNSDMTVINHLPMQEYLYGVVPREIGGNSPIEAVKAQAIVARTYAARNYGRRSALGFDLKPTTDDQAYGGYEWENANSNKAVDQTDGQVITYNNKLISGLYFSTSGGYTESSENVWSGTYDYLKAVPDTYEPEIAGNTTWEVTKSAQEIKTQLAKKGINVGDIVDLIPLEYTDAGRILKLKIVGTNGEEIISKEKVRTVLGLKSQWYTINSSAPTLPGEKPPEEIILDETEEDSNWWQNEGVASAPIEEVELATSSGDNVTVYQQDFSADASKFTKIDNEELIVKERESGEEYIVIEPQIANNIKPLLKSILNILTLKPFGEGFQALKDMNVTTVQPVYHANTTKTDFVFRGRGWGHAVGMSQSGARGMAQNGFSAEEIIKWYYTGVDIID